MGVPSRWSEFSLPPGPITPAVVFLGQNPGVQESKVNKPFVGPSGKTVEESYIKGISLQSMASIYFSNTARCYTPSKAPPKDKHYKTCLPYFLTDLEEITKVHTSAPICVVCLGAPAARFFFESLTGQKLNQKQAFAKNGTVHPFKGRSITFFAVYHPAACLRKRSLIHIVADHMEAVRRFLQGAHRDPGPIRIPPAYPPQEAPPDRRGG